MPSVGDVIKASDLLFARLTSSFALTASNTTLEDVTGLSVSVPANTVYAVDCVLIGFNDAGTTEDIKYGFAFPTGATLRGAIIGGTTGGVSGSSASDMTIFSPSSGFTSGSTALPVGLSTSATVARVSAVLVMSSTAGTFKVQAAQATSGTNISRVQTASYIMLTRVG